MTTQTKDKDVIVDIIDFIEANLVIALTAILGVILLIWGIYRVDDYYIESSVSGTGLIIAGAVLLAGSQLSYYLKQLQKAV